MRGLSGLFKTVSSIITGVVILRELESSVKVCIGGYDMEDIVKSSMFAEIMQQIVNIVNYNVYFCCSVCAS